MIFILKMIKEILATDHGILEDGNIPSGSSISPQDKIK